MPFLSAFDEGEWEQVAGNWELKEYQHRQETLEERLSRLEEISSLYAAGPEGAPQAAVDELCKSWPDDPHARHRTWEVWWESRDR